MVKDKLVAKEVEWEFSCVGCQFREAFDHQAFMDELNDGGYDPLWHPDKPFYVRHHPVADDANAIGCFWGQDLIGFIPRDRQTEFMSFVFMLGESHEVQKALFASTLVDETKGSIGLEQTPLMDRVWNIINRKVEWSLVGWPTMQPGNTGIVRWFNFKAKVVLDETEEFFSNFGF